MAVNGSACELHDDPIFSLESHTDERFALKRQDL